MDEKNFLAEDDGLITPNVGTWARRKYKVIYEYNKLFSSGMKNIWENRIYIVCMQAQENPKLKKRDKSFTLLPCSP